MCSQKVCKNEKQITFYNILYLIHTLIFCILSYCLYIFKLLAKVLNFIFIEVTWKLGFLRILNFIQEKWLRGYASCPHAKWCEDKRFPTKCELWVEMSHRITRTRFQDPLIQKTLIFQNSKSTIFENSKITNIWGSN